MMSRVNIFSKESWTKHASDIIIENIYKVLRDKKTCSVALSGGNSSKSLYQYWAKTHLLDSFDGLIFYLGDERWVPSTHADSNYGMIRNTLIANNFKKNSINLHSIFKDSVNMERAAEMYSLLLPDVIDILLLGVGDDGHIASIFPGDGNVLGSSLKVVTSYSQNHSHYRLTITPKVINCSKNIYILARGENKHKVWIKAMEDPLNIEELPARLVLNGRWLFDHFPD